MGRHGSIGLLALALLVVPNAEVRAQSPGWQKILQGWSEGPPAQLQANGAGPFWSRRSRDVIFMDGLVAGQLRRISQVQAPTGHPPFTYRPQLMRGHAIGPELFYRNRSNLVAQNGYRLAGALGKAEWEYYGAARNGMNLFAAAFGIRRSGFSRVAYIYDPAKPVIVAELRAPGAGVWVPTVLASNTMGFVVYRGFLLHPGKGHGVIIEAMKYSDLKAQKRWNPIRAQWSPAARDFFYGDPSAVLDTNGLPHFVATIWNPQDQPTGRLVVDGKELNYAGRASYWLPQIAFVQGFGLVVSLVGPNGNVQLGHVRNGQFTFMTELPGRDALLAAHGPQLYASTTDGLWTFRPTAARSASVQEEDDLLGIGGSEQEVAFGNGEGQPQALGAQVPAWPIGALLPMVLLGLMILGSRKLKSARV